MEKGTIVKVSNPHQINYSLEGEVIQEGTALNGLIMSRVKFVQYGTVWFADQDLKVIADAKEKDMYTK